MSERLKDEVWTALNAAPKPIDEETALSIALKSLEGHATEIFQFTEWFKSNGASLVARLNA